MICVNNQNLQNEQSTNIIVIGGQVNRLKIYTGDVYVHQLMADGHKIHSVIS